MKELLENAVLSIELGVEDYQTGDDRRVLSAMRNLYAGVLLLCKQVLWNESPPKSDGSLIYKDLVPRKIDGAVIMVPRKPNRNTVDRQQIEDRFKELHLNLDWSKLNDLARIRNDVEHLFMTVKPAIAKEALASAMPVIEQLLVGHLQEEPAHLFQDGVWKALLKTRRCSTSSRRGAQSPSKRWNGGSRRFPMPSKKCAARAAGHPWSARLTPTTTASRRWIWTVLNVAKPLRGRMSSKPRSPSLLPVKPTSLAPTEGSLLSPSVPSVSVRAGCSAKDACSAQGQTSHVPCAGIPLARMTSTMIRECVLIIRIGWNKSCANSALQERTTIAFGDQCDQRTTLPSWTIGAVAVRVAENEEGRDDHR